MKRILLLVTAFMLLSIQGFSQFGIKGGLNFNSDENFKLKDVKFENKTGYHVGILYKAKIPLIGIAIQPELLYSQSNTSIKNASTNGDIKVSQLQLPVSLQWGIDLVLLRPYLQAVPYIGYLLNSKLDIAGNNLDIDNPKFRYGIGLGAGLEIWKFQISGKYNWDLGSVAEFNFDEVKNLKQNKNKGFELSLALLF